MTVRYRLAMSGFTAEADADRAHDAGFDAHIAKPVEADELVEAVHEALALRQP